MNQNERKHYCQSRWYGFKPTWRVNRKTLSYLIQQLIEVTIDYYSLLTIGRFYCCSRLLVTTDLSIVSQVWSVIGQLPIMCPNRSSLHNNSYRNMNCITVIIKLTTVQIYLRLRFTDQLQLVVYFVAVVVKTILTSLLYVQVHMLYQRENFIIWVVCASYSKTSKL